MSTTQELVELQCLWLDTSKIPGANRRVLIEPLLIALDHIKYSRLPREESISSLCGLLLKLQERFKPPVAVKTEEGAAVHIQTYVERLFRYFEEELAGSRSHLTHKRESLEDGYFFLLLQRRVQREKTPLTPS